MPVFVLNSFSSKFFYFAFLFIFFLRKIYISGKARLTMEFEIVKLSSKGQVVIPSELRNGFNEGDKLLIIRSGDKIIIERASELDEKLNEDLEFAKRTEEAYKRIEAGEGITMDFNDFIKEMKKW